MQFLSSAVGLLNIWLWLLILAVLATYVGKRLGVKVLSDIFDEIVVVVTLLWNQFKGNLLVLIIAGVLFFLDQRLFTILLLIVGVVIAIGDRINQAIRSIKLPGA